MGKKNVFVTTIGFNKHDPNHVAVAELLNSMKRGKAQYLVNAVLEKIRRFVLQVLEEHEQQGSSHDVHVENEGEQMTEEAPGGMEFDLDEDALAGIMSSLEAFKG